MIQKEGGIVKRNKIILIASISAAVLLLLIGILVSVYHKDPDTSMESTAAPTQLQTQAQTAAPSTTPSEETTQPSESETTQPAEQVFTLTFVGDCTLGTDPNWMGSGTDFLSVVGNQYDYPFMYVADIFRADDCTFANLEGVLADSGTPEEKRFRFRGPVAYTNILTGSSVEAVNLANNHTYDFGNAGYKSTTDALDAAGVAYAGHCDATLITTESGLKIGLYGITYDLNYEDMVADVAYLRSQGAQVIVAGYHDGMEGYYRPTEQQRTTAHRLIDPAWTLFGGMKVMFCSPSRLITAV